VGIASIDTGRYYEVVEDFGDKPRKPRVAVVVGVGEIYVEKPGGCGRRISKVGY